MTAEMTAGGLAMPAEAETPTPPAVEGEPEEQPRRIRRKAIIALILLGILAMLVTIAAWYLLFRQPIAEVPLPGIPQVEVPTYATSVYGAQRPAGVTVNGSITITSSTPLSPAA